MEIFVFKTNLKYKKNLADVIPHLNSIEGIIRWNVDFHDQDRVLRIVSHQLSPQLVTRAVHAAGYVCEELPD
jgi:hypothetical protein